MSQHQVERVVGLFLFAGTAGLLGLVVLSTVGSGWFVQKNHYALVLDHGTGLVPGTQVSIAGLEVGRVETVRLRRDHRVEAVLAVRRSYAPFVKQDSVGRVSTTLTGKMVVIDKGAEDAPVLEDGGHLVSGPHFDVMIALERMDLVGNLERLQKVLSELNTLAAQLKLGEGRFPEALENVVSLLDDLQAGKGSVGRVLKDDALVDDVEGTLSAVNTLLDSVERASTRLTGMAEAVERASSDVSESTGHIEAATTHIAGTAEDIAGSSERLQQTMLRLDQSLEELGQTLEAIQGMPFVRGQVRKQGREGADAAPPETP